MGYGIPCLKTWEEFDDWCLNDVDYLELLI